MFRSDHAGPMNLGNPNEFTVKELAEEVLRAVSRTGDGPQGPGTRTLPLPEDDPKVRQPDITMAREKLGWEPEVGLSDGLARTIPWFRTQVEGFDARARPLT
jgi:nucleoside-diphosphate-sugar epimerase